MYMGLKQKTHFIILKRFDTISVFSYEARYSVFACKGCFNNHRGNNPLKIAFYL